MMMGKFNKWQQIRSNGDEKDLMMEITANTADWRRVILREKVAMTDESQRKKEEDDSFTSFFFCGFSSDRLCLSSLYIVKCRTSTDIYYHIIINLHKKKIFPLYTTAAFLYSFSTHYCLLPTASYSLYTVYSLRISQWLVQMTVNEMMRWLLIHWLLIILSSGYWSGVVLSWVILLLSLAAPGHL